MKQDVIVIGAGIVGLATTERLLMQGLKVTILERGKVGQESSWAGGGILSPLYPWNYSDAVTYLARYSAEQFPQWIAVLHDISGIDPEYDQSGLLILPPYDMAIAQEWCSSHATRVECHKPPDSMTIGCYQRAAAENKAEHALFMPDVAQVRNPRLLHALLSRVRQLGANIVEHCAVDELSIKKNRVRSVISSCGEFSADSFVICAGAWSREVLGLHALNLAIKPVRGQMLLFKFDAPPISSIMVQDSLYLIPRRDGHLLVGSTLEDTGFEKETTMEAREYLLTRAQLILPELAGISIKQQWSGLRPGTPGNIPVIGRHPVIDNLLINSGHFRYGVTMAPASAEILVNTITGTVQPFDVTPYQAGWNLE